MGGVGKTPCEYCGESFVPQRLKFHIASKHFDAIKAELADVKSKLESANLADHPEPVVTVEDRKAILADWLAGMTLEAWTEIGKQSGYFAEATAPLADPAAETDKSQVKSTKPDDAIDAKSPAPIAELAGPPGAAITENPEPGHAYQKVFLAQHGIVATVAESGIYIAYMRGPYKNGVIGIGNTESRAKEQVQKWYHSFFAGETEKHKWPQMAQSFGLKVYRVKQGSFLVLE